MVLHYFVILQHLVKPAFEDYFHGHILSFYVTLTGVKLHSQLFVLFCNITFLVKRACLCSFVDVKLMLIWGHIVMDVQALQHYFLLSPASQFFCLVYSRRDKLHLCVVMLSCNISA